MNAKPTAYFVLGLLLVLSIGKIAACAASPSAVRDSGTNLPQAVSATCEAADFSEFGESPDIDDFLGDAPVAGDELRPLPYGRPFLFSPSFGERCASCVRGRGPPSLLG